MDQEITATQVVEGEVDVSLDGRLHRVLLPAGVGVPGAEETDVAAALVAELCARGASLADVLDLSELLSRDPGLVADVARRVVG